MTPQELDDRWVGKIVHRMGSDDFGTVLEVEAMGGVLVLHVHWAPLKYGDDPTPGRVNAAAVNLFEAGDVRRLFRRLVRANEQIGAYKEATHMQHQLLDGLTHTLRKFDQQ